MSWEPNFEEVLHISNHLRPTFEQYSQQDEYGLALRPKNVRLDVKEDDVDDELSVAETLKADARAELELKAYSRKFGASNKKEIRKWHDQEEDSHNIDGEISNMIRSSGLEREPPPNYRPNSKMTSKSAVPTDKLPVAGVKNLFLSDEHFKFENPYVRFPKSSDSTVGSKSSDTTEEKKVDNRSEDEPSNSRKSYKEVKMGAPGEKYVTPRQLYVMKARMNRR